LDPQGPIEGDGLAIERKRIERRIEDLATGARMGCKGISNSSAIFEKCHRENGVSRVVGRIERGDEVKGSSDIAAFYGWIFEFNTPLVYRDLLCFRCDELEHFDQKEQNLSVHSLL
jgi:hypothetical protein